MRILCTMLFVAALAFPAAASECGFQHREPFTKGQYEQRMFVNECGQRYEVGYRLEGPTLHFPSGGKHTVANLPDDKAQELLRKTYGLEGQGDALIRTKWSQ